MGPIDLIVRIFSKFFPPDAPRADEPEPAAPEPEPKPKPEPPKTHWDSDMIPRETGPGGTVEHSGGGYICCGTVRLEWVSRETDEEGKPLRTRTPDSHTETMPYNAFTAAGKKYGALHQLVYRWEDKYSPWAKDIYGRTVLSVAERFPCFDSSDYLYEDRYFRWFLLCEEGKFTCVYYTDETNTVTVTEDVRDMEKPCWKEISKQKCFD